MSDFCLFVESPDWMKSRGLAVDGLLPGKPAAVIPGTRGVTLTTDGTPGAVQPALAAATPARPQRPKKLFGENAPLATRLVGMFPTTAVS